MLIRKGDIVWLKSGGPKMTVLTINPDDVCTCVWFKYGEIQYFDFEIVALTKSDPFCQEKKISLRKNK